MSYSGSVPYALSFWKRSQPGSSTPFSHEVRTHTTTILPQDDSSLPVVDVHARIQAMDGPLNEVASYGDVLLNVIRKAQVGPSRKPCTLCQGVCGIAA